MTPMTAFVYMLQCIDGSYYVGSTSGELEKRMAEHEAGTYGGYTSSRRPVKLIWSESFMHITDAIAAERKIKGWSRVKKEALARGDWERMRTLAKRKGGRRFGAVILRGSLREHLRMTVIYEARHPAVQGRKAVEARRMTKLGERYSSTIATARVQPAEAPLIFTGKQAIENPVAGSASRLWSFSMWQ